MTDNDLWGMTALLVEPDPEVRDTVRPWLTRRGVTVFEASNHREAVELLAETHSSMQVLIIELMLPDLAGWHLARVVRAIESGLPMIFVSSAEKPADDKLNELVGGSWSFLEKPVSEEQLIHELRALPRSGGGSSG